MLTHDELAIIVAKTAELVLQQMAVPKNGMHFGGTWDPAAGVGDMLQSDTASVFTDQGNVPLTHSRVQIACADIGDQAGPTGDETYMLVPGTRSYVAIPIHDPMNSPGAPAGERWITGRKRYLLKTKGGFQLDINDSTDTITMTAPTGGVVFEWNDDAGTLQLGGSGLTEAENAVGVKSTLQTDYDAIIEAVQSAFTEFAATVQSGDGAPPPTVGMVTASGSSTVFAKT